MRKVGLGLVWCLLWAAALAAAEPSAEDAEFFEKQVRPILARSCYECHSGKTKQPKGNLRLDSRASMLKGGDSGAAIVPSEPKKSLLVDAINYGDLFQMPPKTRLSSAEVAVLTRWIERGAPWPNDAGATIPLAGPQDFNLAQRRADHWCWQPLKNPPPQAVKHADWQRDPLDQFILARLEKAGLTPAAEVDRGTWLRRVTLVLAGLPPTPAEIEAFLADEQPGAYERVVDRLLESPRYGERFARHWLDLARYAETRGHEFDYTLPNAWQYRDYVIRAFNADVPYDQFLTEQVAGDLLAEPRVNPENGFNESILGTGFWFLGEWVHSPVDIRQDQCDRYDNMVDTFGKTFLGLTIGCARCHDHKFDAISQADYYAQFGFLHSSSYRLARFETMLDDARAARELEAARAEAKQQILPAYRSAQGVVLDRLQDYLKAAAGSPATAEGLAKLDATATAEGLDPQVMRAWAQQLARSATDVNDPLHAWGKLGNLPADQFGKAWQELAKQALARHEQREKVVMSALDGMREIAIYDRAGRELFLSDGQTFGSRTMHAGEVRLGLDPARPIERVLTASGVHRDPAWNNLTAAAGAELDPGRLGGTMAAGRTFKTPQFALDTGVLYYYIEGPCRVYAAVGSHAVINGPLHGKIVMDVKGDPAGPRWHRHDLSMYRGQNLHVEFTADAASELAIYAVVEAKEGAPSPGNPIPAPNAVLANVFRGTAIERPEQLAAALAKALRGAADRLGADKLESDPDPASWSQLAQWMVERPELFLPSGKPREALTAAVTPHAERMNAVVGSIQRASALAPAMWDGTPFDERLLIRGNSKNPGPVVPRRMLEAFGGQEFPRPEHGSGRLKLAQWLTDPARTPLVPRVYVNRLWHHVFGRGIVASTDNFGVLGELPTHPELLDYLSTRFVREGWSTKRMLRALVLSATFRQSSVAAEQADEADPTNALWHRSNVRRLEAEAIRDSLLAISGRLNEQMYGKSVPVFLTPFMDGRGKPGSGPLDGAGRRSVYLAVRRNFLSPMLLAFDFPIPFAARGTRTRSNVPAQALILLNDPLVTELANHWGKRVAAGADGGGAKPQEKVDRMYLAAFGRLPEPAEREAAIEFLKQRSAELGLNDPQLTDARPWSELAHVLVNVKEFIFIP